MPAVLTHKAIMLLAMQRLAEIRDALKAKQRAGLVGLTTLERSLMDLADKAYKMMSTEPHPATEFPEFPFTTPLGKDVSKLAVLGSMGPDLTGFSALLAPGQAWVFDTVHKGYPDADREVVVARTCDFALALWQRLSDGVTAAYPPGPQRDRNLEKARAYVLGHLCHVAADVVSHPFINDLEWHQGTSSRKKLQHADGEVSHDAAVARSVFQRSSTREGNAWDEWWPTFEDLPRPFFSAYADALEDTYTARTARRQGFLDFENRMTELGPPSMDAAFVLDGFNMYRGAILSIGYGYGTWKWFAFLLPLSLPLMVLPFVYALIPWSRRHFIGGPAQDPDRPVQFALTFPMLLGSAVSLYYGIRIASLTTKGVEARSTACLVTQVVLVLMGFLNLGAFTDPSFPNWLRWVLFLALPLTVYGVMLVMALADWWRGEEHPYRRRAALMLIHSAPPLVIFGFSVLSLVLGAPEGDHVGFWIGSFAWSIVFFVGFLLIARYVLRDSKIPEDPQGPGELPHHVRLFDDATLFWNPALAAPKLTDRFLPSGRRKLLKLWWEGTGDLYIRVDRYQLVFNSVAQDTATKQIVPAPIAPMKLEEFIHQLERTVKEPGGATGKLKSAIVYPADAERGLNYELPPGATFSDHGDEEETVAGHLAKAREFKKIGTSQDSSDYFLYHAPKPVQSVRFGRKGPVANPFDMTEEQVRSEELVSGYKYVLETTGIGGYRPPAYAASDMDLLRAEDSVMSHAVDLAALLCLGGASHMAQPAGNKIYQVFRNWNLDRRRVNEWRMLVAGGALSEKGGHPEKYDAAMLAPPSPDAWNAPGAANLDALKEGERTACAMGWTHLLREWLDMASRSNGDPIAETRLNPNNPTNRAMSRGLAFLLDMEDPHR